MTDIEYKEQSERVEKYNKCADRVSVIGEKKSAIQNGILSIQCSGDKQIDFDYLGNDFKKRLVENITFFLKARLKTLRKKWRRYRMKLFQVNYLENNDDETYLTVGADDDTSETIEKREYEKCNDWNCLYFLRAKEISEVDDHKIIVQ